MIAKDDAVVREAFKKILEETKEDIGAGRITFHNPPPFWTEEMVKATALNCALIRLAEASKWN